MSTTQIQTSISPRELHRLVTENPATELLDVRLASEFNAAHVPGARLVPLDRLKPADYLAQRTGGKGPIYVLCHSGGRAVKAIEMFRRAGFDDCVLVEGGTQAWIDAGLPVNLGASKVLPLMRQVQVAVGLVTAAGAVLALTVDARFAALPLLMGCGLLFAGVTGNCALATLLSKMPWNRGSGGSGSTPQNNRP